MAARITCLLLCGQQHPSASRSAADRDYEQCRAGGESPCNVHKHAAIIAQVLSPSLFRVLQSLAFIMGMKEDVYLQFATQDPGAGQVACSPPLCSQRVSIGVMQCMPSMVAILHLPHAGFSISVDARMAALDSSRKLTLVQKLVAASGPQSTPLLLAWAADTIRQACAAQCTDPEVAREVWFQEMLPLATAWAAQHQNSTKPQLAAQGEQQLMLQLLQAPGAVRWDDLLALPHFPFLTASLAAKNPMLCSVLGMLGLPGAAPDQPPSDPGSPLLSAQSAAMLAADTKQAMAAKLSAQGPQGVPADLLLRASTAPAEMRADLAVAATLLRLLR